MVKFPYKKLIFEMNFFIEMYTDHVLACPDKKLSQNCSGDGMAKYAVDKPAVFDLDYDRSLQPAVYDRA